MKNCGISSSPKTFFHTLYSHHGLREHLMECSLPADKHTNEALCSISETPTKPLLGIKGITEVQVKEEQEKQGINIYRTRRIVNKSTHKQTTFIKVHLSNPDQTAGVFHEGFIDGPFPVHSGEGTTHRQMLHNHISINCTNPVVSLRCGENHHYKTYTKGKREARCTGEHSTASKTCTVYLSYMTPSTKTPTCQILSWKGHHHQPPQPAP